MIKIFKFFLTAVIVILIVAFFAKNWILKAAVEQSVTLLTGFKTTVGGLKYDFPSTLHIKELEIRNPEGFKEEIFASIPEIYVSLVLPELIRQERLHLTEVRLHLKEVHVEKNEQGVSNISLLTSAGGPPKQQEKQKKEEPGEPKKAMPFYLDRFVLTMREVSYEDRSSGLMAKAPLPEKVLVDMKIEQQVFTDIGNPQALVNLILLKIVQGTTFGNLMGLAPDGLQSALADTMGTGQEMLKQAGGAVTAQAGKVIPTDMGGTTDKLTDAGSAAKEKVAGLFGKLKTQLASEDSGQ